MIARGSCFECVPLLRLLLNNDLITKEIHDELLQNLEVIGKMLSSYIKNTFDND